jgi:peptidyl-prolyl cis-trans isomerase SurA
LLFTIHHSPFTIHHSLFTVSPAGAHVLDKIVARVNGDIILMSDLKGRSMQFLSEMKRKNQPVDEDNIHKVEKEILNEMIEERLMLQFANNNNIKILDEDIKTAIEDVKKQNNFTDEMLEKVLKNENVTINDYRERLKEQMMISKVINYEVKSNIHIEENEIKKYYEEHRDEFKTPEEVRVRHMVFMYSEEERDSSKEEMIRKKAVDILNKIREGEDFAKLASIYSEDPSAKSGGDLGYFPRGKMIKDFEDAAFILKKGEVSDVIRTPYGFHIIKCEDKKEAGFRPAEEVSGEIEKSIFLEKMKSLKNIWMKKMKEKAFIDVLY